MDVFAVVTDEGDECCGGVPREVIRVFADREHADEFCALYSEAEGPASVEAHAISESSEVHTFACHFTTLNSRGDVRSNRTSIEMDWYDEYQVVGTTTRRVPIGTWVTTRGPQSVSQMMHDVAVRYVALELRREYEALRGK